eukprot:2009544-Pyramimonas_sp.AAC.1
MRKEGNASARDRRTALDLAVIREALEHARGHVHWIPHGRMPVDCMSKDDISKGNAALSNLHASGMIVLVDEDNEMALRRDKPDQKD